MFIVLMQFVGIAVFSFLVVGFYAFLGPFLGNRIAEITMLMVFSSVVLLVIFLFVRCTAIDPTDKTSFKKKRKKSGGFSKRKYGFILGQIVVRFFKRIERKILRCCIRRRYLYPLKSNIQLEPLILFPLVVKDDVVTPDVKDDDITFCALCDFEVRKHSKHCRSCHRCVEGFDHHCRWLNNCIGKKNYTTFILLMVFVLLMLFVEGGTAVAIFVRCFADKKGLEKELEKKLYIEFPRGVLAAISVLLFLLTAYGSAALGQLFFFHLVLIRKVMSSFYVLIFLLSIFGLEGFLENKTTQSSLYLETSKPESIWKKRSRGSSQTLSPIGWVDLGSELDVVRRGSEMVKEMDQVMRGTLILLPGIRKKLIKLSSDDGNNVHIGSYEQLGHLNGDGRRGSEMVKEMDQVMRGTLILLPGIRKKLIKLSSDDGNVVLEATCDLNIAEKGKKLIKLSSDDGNVVLEATCDLNIAETGYKPYEGVHGKYHLAMALKDTALGILSYSLE
ncbi:hypothetical protein GIB67_024877 [Kingdonia uniflora]|uniref:S-acyltransferase n=1 Tax=Kingdonia uniflora TaxID=39325 RepID=A0A7J7NYJ4_9MAGN|nr:hypothetical protein GIB67_024877 [Kingdonia uniflora]